jgi:uncharacterized membrane protein
MTYLLAFGIGAAAGLRSLSPPAIVAWFAQGRWPALQQSPLSFMAAPITAWIFTVLGAVELVTDKLPFTPSRLTPPPFLARILMGGLCGAVLVVAAGQSLVAGAAVGAVGGVAGSFAGYHARRALVGRGIPDPAVAVAEDVLTLALAYVIASGV